LLHRDLRLGGGGFLGQIGGAELAQAALGVPAFFRTDPFAAARALLEVRSGLLDRLGEGGVAGVAAVGVAELVGGPGKPVPGAPGRSGRARPPRSWLESGRTPPPAMPTLFD